MRRVSIRTLMSNTVQTTVGLADCVEYALYLNAEK